MYIAHTIPRRYTLEPLSLVLYLEEEEQRTYVDSKSRSGIKPIGPRYGVIYSRLFKYTQHAAGFTENIIWHRIS